MEGRERGKREKGNEIGVKKERGRGGQYILKF